MDCGRKATEGGSRNCLSSAQAQQPDGELDSFQPAISPRHPKKVIANGFFPSARIQWHVIKSWPNYAHLTLCHHCVLLGPRCLTGPCPGVFVVDIKTVLYTGSVFEYIRAWRFQTSGTRPKQDDEASPAHTHEQGDDWDRGVVGAANCFQTF